MSAAIFFSFIYIWRMFPSSAGKPREVAIVVPSWLDSGSSFHLYIGEQRIDMLKKIGKTL